MGAHSWLTSCVTPDVWHGGGHGGGGGGGGGGRI